MNTSEKRIEGRFMSDEQEIKNVPSGWRIVRLLEDTFQGLVSGQGSARVILERIPKANQKVIVAEWDLRLEEIILPDRSLLPLAWFEVGNDVKSRTPDRIRIEERDVQ